MDIRWSQLRELMKFRGYTYDRLAEESGCSKSTLQKLISGAIDDPRISTLYYAAKALGASLDRLLGLAPPRDYTEENRAYDANLMETMQERLALQNKAIEEQRQKIHDHEITISTQKAIIEARDATIEQDKAVINRLHRSNNWGRVGMFALFLLLLYLVWEIINLDKGITALMYPNLHQ